MLQSLLTEVLESDIELAAYFLAQLSGYANATRFSQRLQAHGDIDAISEEVAAIDHDIAKVYADAQAYTALAGYAGVRVIHVLLKFDSAGKRIDRASKLDQDAVTHRLEYSAAMFGDERREYLGSPHLEGGERTGFVQLDQTGIADHIDREDRGEPTLRTLVCHRANSLWRLYAEILWAPN